MGTFLKTLIALMLGFIALSASAAENIQVQDPWVRAAPPNVKVLAAYMEIINNGAKPQILTSVSSTAFNQVGIHRTVIHENMAHMEHLKELTIPPHTTVVFTPGGLHFMLTGAKKPLHSGDQVPMTLTFSNGKKIAVIATVRSGQANDKEEHQHMNHSGHENHKP